jgi:hypothetical protein
MQDDLNIGWDLIPIVGISIGLLLLVFILMTAYGFIHNQLWET